MLVWTWSGLAACLFRSCIDVIVVRIKASRGIEEPISRMGIDSPDTSQPPNGEICIDKFPLLYFQITKLKAERVNPYFKDILLNKILTYKFLLRKNR